MGSLHCLRPAPARVVAEVLMSSQIWEPRSISPRPPAARHRRCYPTISSVTGATLDERIPMTSAAAADRSMMRPPA